MACVAQCGRAVWLRGWAVAYSCHRPQTVPLCTATISVPGIPCATSVNTQQITSKTAYSTASGNTLSILPNIANSVSVNIQPIVSRVATSPVCVQSRTLNSYASNCMNGLNVLQRPLAADAVLVGRHECYSTGSGSTSDAAERSTKMEGAENNNSVLSTNSNDASTNNNNEVSTLSDRLRFYHPTCSEDTKREISASFELVPDFITSEEEELLLKEVEPHLKRQRYEFSHWDEAIVGYRELELSHWSSLTAAVLQRVRAHAFPQQEEVLVRTHVLDLSEDGHIKPHVDSVRFCGNIISGLSLSSAAVMRLVKEGHQDQVVDVLLPRRSLYVMRDDSRYSYTHELLHNDVSALGAEAVRKTRRVSIICRNEP